MQRSGQHVVRTLHTILQKNFVRRHKEFYRVYIMDWDADAVQLLVAFLLAISERHQHSVDMVTEMNFK